jgi:hypothetical protein
MMTQDQGLCPEEIIRMAREASADGNGDELTGDAIERFAALVAEAERERAWTEKDWDEAAEWIRQQEREKVAKVCEEKYQSCRFDEYRDACQDIASAIRSMK